MQKWFAWVDELKAKNIYTSGEPLLPEGKMVKGADDHHANTYLQKALSLTTSLAEKKLITSKLETLSRTKLN